MAGNSKTKHDMAVRVKHRQGRTIRQVRRRQGISAKELASKIGVTPGAISQWETGLHTPRVHNQTALARALGVPWSTLFGLDGEVA